MQVTENSGLFNEINPVYISLNLGRPNSAFQDDFIPKDKFRLIKREAVNLMGSRWMMVNYLKSDYLTQITERQGYAGTASESVSFVDAMTPLANKEKKPFQYVIRIVAFESDTNCQFSFDMNYNDLMILTHGNVKLLEDECSNDLCQIISNSLTIIKRDKTDKDGQPLKLEKREDVLITEHKIFFNE